MATPATKLTIGKRYWLDSLLDVSGVVVKINHIGVYFAQIEGSDVYCKDDQGQIKFGNKEPYRYYEYDENRPDHLAHPANMLGSEGGKNINHKSK